MIWVVPRRLPSAWCGAAALLTLLALPHPGHAGAEVLLSGHWVMAQRTTNVARVPILGNIYATSEVVTLLQLRHDRGRLFGTGRLCRLELDSGSRWVSTRLRAEAKALLPAPVVDARLGLDGAGNVTLRQDKRVVVVGARLDNPSSDPLPRIPSDPTVFDEDRDGLPGMTVEIGGIAPGRIYVAQRSWTELSGRMVARDGFAGQLRFGNEQVVLQATSQRLEHAPVTHPVPSQSWFRMRRLPDHADCALAEVVARSWFRETEP
jgi:hypothetical protein